MKGVEVCVFSVDDAYAAEAAGCARLELCLDYDLGGITPLFEDLQRLSPSNIVDDVRRGLRVPAVVMVRPRGGDFLYSKREKKWMLTTIKQVAKLGFQGVVCTDDLSMAAARQLDGRTLSYTEAVITALQAGCDLALLCNRSAVNGGEELDTVLDQLAEAQLKGQWLPSEISEERRLNLLPRSPARPWDELVRSSDYMQALDRLP